MEKRNAPAPEKVPRPSSSKCDLSGLSRYSEIRHQHFGETKECSGPEEEQEGDTVTGSLLGNAIEQCQPGRVRSGVREQEGFGPERVQEVT